MKKVLFGTTALVAAGFIGSTAQAAEPITLSVGGMMNQWMAIGSVDSYTYKGTEGNNKSSNGLSRDYGNVSLVSDTEVHFKGATTLDNGLKVAVQIELEAERSASSTARNADQQYVTLSGGWGQVRVGEMLSAATIVHQQAPTAGANMADVANMFPTTVPNGNAVTTLTNQTTTVDGIINAGRCSVAIDYISPMFGPFAFGVTYTPNVGSRGFAQESNSANDLLGGALVYADKWGPVGVNMDVAYARYDYQTTMTAAGSLQSGTNGVVHGLPVGVKLSYAGFEVGGSYFRIFDSSKGQGATAAPANNGLGEDGHAWDAGIAYTTGPWRFAYAYYASSFEGAASVAGRDEQRIHNAGGQYTMGPGVIATANIAYEENKDGDRTVTGNKQESLALITGLKLSF